MGTAPIEDLRRRVEVDSSPGPARLLGLVGTRTATSRSFLVTVLVVDDLAALVVIAVAPSTSGCPVCWSESG